jgi:hypothetical protein
MNFNEFSDLCFEGKWVTLERFGNKTESMTFLMKENGWAAFMEVNGWFMWYYLDNSTLQWKDTHMLQGENWLNHE